jgi:glutathione S-transferase
MKFYYSPGACSMSMHCLLEEIGQPYEAQVISLREKQQFSADYLEVNPKAQVPALVRDDGSVLTELVAIAVWLAESNPALGLMPSGAEAMARMFEMMMLVVTNMHPQGVTRIFRTDKFTPNATDYDAVRERGREIVKEGAQQLEASFKGSGPFLFDRLTIGDFVAFYIEYWIVHRLKWPLAPRSAAHYEAMMARDSIKRTLAAESYPFQSA